MTPEEKEEVIENIDWMIKLANTLFRKRSESWEHITACLQDRQIEIKQGEWDD